MLSRVAESMFWMSRYMERAENTARFLDVHFQLLLDLNKITLMDPAISFWEPLVLIASDWQHFHQFSDRYDAEPVTEFLVFNRDNPNSIASCIAMARENARSIIESISSEMWEQINGMYHSLQKKNVKLIRSDTRSIASGGDPYSLFGEIKKGSHLFQGITDCTLSRSEGWEFIQIGKYLERADNTGRLIDVKYHSLRHQAGLHYGSVDVIEWMAVLRSCCALEAFRRAYHSKIEPDTILHYLMLDRDFPRSVYFCIAAAEEALWRISGSTRHKHLNGADQEAGRLLGDLSWASVDDFYRRGLREYMSELKRRLAHLGEQIHQTYFAYNAPLEGYENVPSLPFMGLSGGHALWSQAQQQQQQSRQG